MDKKNICNGASVKLFIYEFKQSNVQYNKNQYMKCHFRNGASVFETMYEFSLIKCKYK